MMAVTDSKPSSKLTLIPWDYESEQHAERMVAQRIACGWRSDEVELWRDLGRKGIKEYYWIVGRHFRFALHLYRRRRTHTILSNRHWEMGLQTKRPYSRSTRPNILRHVSQMLSNSREPLFLTVTTGSLSHQRHSKHRVAQAARALKR